MKLFPSGQTYHENKKLIKLIQAKEYKPYVFHMCWTDNRENKVVYFKDVGLWYIPDNHDVCNDGSSMISYAITYNQNRKSSSFMRDKCCMRKNYWPVDKS